MAVTNQKSTQLGRTASQPLDGSQVSAGVQLAPFSFTQSGAGDANSTVDLCQLSGGRIVVVPALCSATVSAWGTSRTVAIGHRANRARSDGSVVAEDNDSILTASTTAAAGGTIAGSAFTALDIEVLDRLEVFATVAGGTIPDGATLSGVIAYRPLS